MRGTYPDRVLGYRVTEIKGFRLVAVVVDILCLVFDMTILLSLWGIISAVVKSVYLTLICMFISCVVAMLVVFALRCFCLKRISQFKIYTIYEYCKGRELVFEELIVSKTTLYDLIVHRHGVEIVSDLESTDMSNCFESYLNSIYGWRDKSEIFADLSNKNRQMGTEIYKIRVSSLPKGSRRFGVIDIEVKSTKEG